VLYRSVRCGQRQQKASSDNEQHRRLDGRDGRLLWAESDDRDLTEVIATVKRRLCVSPARDSGRAGKDYEEPVVGVVLSHEHIAGGDLDDVA
jgi:hypothetical protein